MTVRWRSPPVNRPENALLGIMSEGVITWGNDYPFVVRDASHWIYEGTGADPARPGAASSATSTIVSTTTAPRPTSPCCPTPRWSTWTESPVSQSAYYQQGGMVFAAGTVDWAWALDDVRIGDRSIRGSSVSLPTCSRRSAPVRRPSRQRRPRRPARCISRSRLAPSPWRSPPARPPGRCSVAPTAADRPRLARQADYRGSPGPGAIG